MPGAIDAKNAKPARRETIGERDAHIREIARGAVDEQGGAAFAALRSALDDVDRAGAGLDEFADGRKAAFDPPRLDEAEEEEGEAEGGQRGGAGDHWRPPVAAPAVTAPDPRGRL